MYKNGNIRESRESISYYSVNLNKSYIFFGPQSHCLVDLFRAFPILKSVILIFGGNGVVIAAGKFAFRYPDCF